MVTKYLEFFFCSRFASFFDSLFRLLSSAPSLQRLQPFLHPLASPSSSFLCSFMSFPFACIRISLDEESVWFIHPCFAEGKIDHAYFFLRFIFCLRDETPNANKGVVLPPAIFPLHREFFPISGRKKWLDFDQ